MTSTKHKLGEFIEQLDGRNTDGKFKVDDVRGISTSKEFITTKADMDGVSLISYKVVGAGEFAFVPDTSRRGDKMSLAYNNSSSSYIVSSISCVFRVSDQEELLPDYLYIYFNRPEFDRYARFNSWGSARETFAWEDMCDIEIDLPPIEIQKKYVNIYNAMFFNQVCYERGLEDLKLTCESYIENLRNSSPLVKLEEFCELSDERNEDGICKNVKGLTVYKQFIDTKADMDGVSLTNYKIVNPGDIAYVPTTNRNGDRIACGIAEEQYIVSSTYEVLKINKEVCDPHYLFLWFTRAEMDRYARYNSWGSAREVIAFEDLCSYTIPLPGMKVQQSIANIYKCYLERKKINEQLKEDIKTICPTLIKGSLEEANK